MSDARLRELERRWRATGRVEDEAEYLRERVRDGDLDEERLRLAAYVGHPAALQACPMSEVEDIGQWLRGLSAWGDRIALRALTAGLVDQAAREQPGAVQALVGLGAALRAETELPSLRELGPAFYCPPAQVLVLAVQQLRMGRRQYLDPDDPELERALTRARALYPLLHKDRFVYRFSISTASAGWGHRFFYDPPDRRGRLLPPVGASEGWVPPLGSDRVPLGRGVFEGFSLESLSAISELRRSARDELLPWALRHAT